MRTAKIKFSSIVFKAYCTVPNVIVMLSQLQYAGR